MVIACGGGLITEPAARRLLTELCTVVWLDAPDQVLIERMGDGADRPDARRVRGGRDSAISAAAARERISLAHVRIGAGDSAGCGGRLG